MLRVILRALSRALILLAVAVPGSALAQFGVPAPVTPAIPCPAFTGFPLSLNLGTISLFGNDGVTNRCAFQTTQAALNALSTQAVGNAAAVASEVSRATAAEALLAPLASPTFTGTMTAPKLTLTGSGSTGDVSGMSVTANGSTQTLGSFLQAFPGASSNVAGVGVPGLYNPPGFFIYQQPGAFATPPAMRVQRDVPAGGNGSAGNTYKAIWGITNTNANSPGYEWAVTGEVFNKTVGTTGAQNVGVNGTIHKLGTSGGPSIGPSWGGNFNCLDETGQVNPVYSCIGTEINSNTTAAGTDANRQRVGLHVAVSSLSPSTGANFGYGIKVDAYPNDTLDRGIALRARQRIGLDLTGANITGAGISLANGQRIAFDGADVDGSFNRTLRGQDGLLVYATPQGDVFKITDAGQVIAPSITSPTATNGVLNGAFIRTADPTTADIPSGQCADWINTTTGTFYHACVYQGTLRKVAMN